MTNAGTPELEGTTLRVYTYVIKQSKGVGPREVMRGANLSSPSVAYWHLQKLEALGLLQKDAYGEYVAKEKANISGHLWIGRNMVPRLMFYSLFFMGIVAIEFIIIGVQFFAYGQMPEISLIYLLATNFIAMILFLGEGLLLRRKTRTKSAKRNTSDSTS
ncbi:MAG: hypothetical protein WHU54_00625 [Candidatus Bathyarchaeia archaeon]|jgi:hypothetical protein